MKDYGHTVIYMNIRMFYHKGCITKISPNKIMPLEMILKLCLFLFVPQAYHMVFLVLKAHIYYFMRDLMNFYNISTSDQVFILNRVPTCYHNLSNINEEG
jgi:hypothetical protein